MKKLIRNENGYTMIEMIIIIMIISLIFNIAYPKFKKTIAHWELITTAREMCVNIRKWQQKAQIEDKYGLKLVLDLNNRRYQLREGLNIKEAYDLSGIISYMGVNPEGMTSLEFYPSGMTSRAGTITLQHSSGESIYLVILNTTGRIRITFQKPSS